MTLRIGTRSSPLARVQTDMVAHALRLAHPGLQIEIVPIKASGDWKPEQGENRLAEAAGGKGLFIKEVEQAILNGSVDCGVHNLKDVPSHLPEGVAIDHVLEREDARDVLIGSGIHSLDSIPMGAVIGTSSLRRQALLLALRPDLIVKPLRGNVDTRLEKLRAGQVDVAVLAAVGLHRLNRTHEINVYLEPETMLPACGQGTLCIETRVEDIKTRSLLDAIHHTGTGLISAAERAVLADLDGSCRTPIGAYATLCGHMMNLQAVLASPDGKEIYTASGVAQVLTTGQGAQLGLMVAKELRDKAGPDALTRLACDYHDSAHAAQG
jgi:hydroxymethylbilane synthase